MYRALTIVSRGSKMTLYNIQDVFLNSYFKEVVLAEIAFGTQGRTLYIYGIHMYICHNLTQTWYLLRSNSYNMILFFSF